MTSHPARSRGRQIWARHRQGLVISSLAEGEASTQLLVFNSMSWTGYHLNLAQASTLTRGQLLDLLLDVESGLRSFVITILSKHNADSTTLVPKAI